jgi:topoisomerase-4 subunit A
VVYFDACASEAAMPRLVHVSLDGRCRARVREFDFDLSAVSLGGRSAKGIKVTRWPVKDVGRMDPA